MQKLLRLWLITLGSARLFAAEANSTAEIQEAIQKLSDKSNYSWTSVPKSESGNFRLSPTEGKTERSGLIYFKMSVGPNSVEAAIQGDKSAIKTEDQWESSTELQGDRAWLARRLSTFRTPDVEARDLLSKAQAVTKKDGAYSANLTPLGVREILLARRVGATQNSEPASTKGWVKFWTKDGALTKYEYNIQGKMSAGPSSQVLEVNLTTTVEIKDVGKTQVRLPEEARKKLL